MKYSNPPLLKILPKAAFAFRKMTLGHDDYTTCTPDSWAPDQGTFYTPCLSGFREDLGLQHADVGEVAVGSGEIQPVAYDELVGDLEAEVLHV
jgi:hypothetical protein